MIAPHRGQVAEIGRHATPVHEEREVCGKDVFADRSVVQAGILDDGVGHVMRERVQKEVHIGRNGARGAAFGGALAVAFNEAAEVYVLLDVLAPTEN